MAAVIHSLWDRGDKNPLILPASVPIDDPRVQPELTRYLSDNWTPVIEKDVDGPSSLPLRLDAEVPNLGKFAACRRVARTIYLGSAPTGAAAHRGIEDRRVKLGSVMPGESVLVFDDALRRLAGGATYLYQDGNRYWYSTQPTVTKLAEDRAEQLRDADKVVQELEKRLRVDLRRVGDFSRVHSVPHSGQDVPDDLTAGLVVLAVDHPYSKEPGSSAEIAAKAILESRGNTPRLFRNTLVFLAVDRTRFQDLDEAVRLYLAWESILSEKETLDLTGFQVKQAQQQKDAAESAVGGRLPEAYQWLLVPTQATPQVPIEWQAFRLSGEEPLAVRASKKLRNDEHMVTTFAGTRLRMDLDKFLWRGGEHVAVKQLVEDFAKYPYLQRLKGPEVLVAAVSDGLALLTWREDSFAYADSFDEATGRYRGLRCGQPARIAFDDFSGLLVRPEAAQRQIDAEAASSQAHGKEAGGSSSGVTTPVTGTEAQAKPTAPVPHVPKRFHGAATLDPTRVGRDAGRIADEVIAHLAGLVGSKVRVTLEIEAELPSGAPEHVVRTVTENSRTLKLTSPGFEKE